MIKIEKEIGVNRNVMKMKEMTVKEVCDLLKEDQKHSECAGILSGGGVRKVRLCHIHKAAKYAAELW